MQRSVPDLRRGHGTRASGFAGDLMWGNSVKPWTQSAPGVDEVDPPEVGVDNYAGRPGSDFESRSGGFIHSNGMAKPAVQKVKLLGKRRR